MAFFMFCNDEAPSCFFISYRWDLPSKTSRGPHVTPCIYGNDALTNHSGASNVYNPARISVEHGDYSKAFDSVMYQA
jgi:hypothetical protein